MDPDDFYSYVNRLIYYYGYTKYDAIVIFINDQSINNTYKTIPEVNIELEHALELLNINNNNNKNINNTNPQINVRLTNKNNNIN